LLNFIYITV